ncbi:unnamed protein product [Blepharisma stoltei]|uniref:DNA polymerase delta small subunit n=1 Tax=Blepharisma stoltei TaxID=1481888 RepID=A0AAU9JA72_9CILI|nr:unnamed protein product [Blepharisma stoltei]
MFADNLYLAFTSLSIQKGILRFSLLLNLNSSQICPALPLNKMSNPAKGRSISYSYEFLGSRFESKLDFTAQYFNLYRSRLNALHWRSIDTAKAQRDVPILHQIMELKPDNVCIVSGVIVRNHKTRPSIIEKYIAKVGTLEPRPSCFGSFCSEKDEIYLEDESGRVLLDFRNSESDWNDLITGIVVAAYGILRENAVFETLSLYYPQVDRPLPLEKAGEEYICFVSGLEIGSPYYDMILLHLLAQFIQGNLGTQSYDEASKIVRLVILGDSIYKPDTARTVDRKAIGDQVIRGFTEINESLKFLDTFLAELAGTIPVDIIPGEMDPSNCSLPQQPLNPYLFPIASRYSALQSFPNPYEFTIDKCRILCTAGQNISMYSHYAPPDKTFAELMALNVKHRHIAANAPDALQCIPMQDKDPFILDNLPHLYVVGNLGSYQTGMEDGVKLVAVPRFSSPGHNIVLVNRFTLESKTISFESMID